MKRTGWRLVILGAAAAAVAVPAWIEVNRRGNEAFEPSPLPAFTVAQRPQQGRYLFDYAAQLRHYEEGAHRFLRRMTERFHIEALIVTLPNLPDGATPENLAVDIVNQWRVGGEFEGRGLLLMLVDSDKQVKLEVTYELEDAFTDVFTGYVEDLQLRPYYLDGELGTGLIAVMELLEQRAQVKVQGEYTAGVIEHLDQELLSGGAGAGRSLTRYEPERRPDRGSAGSAGGGASPDEAWQVMLKKWAGEGAHIDMDVYTEISKMAMGSPDHADARTRRTVPDWRDADYQVLQNKDHAVIWFGNREGWNYAPFLFCRTPAGWKFDIVSQRRLVVMRKAPKWVIEQGDYPYVTLLDVAPQSTGKDLPLPIGDLYSCREDEEIAAQIRKLRRDLKESPNDVGTLMPLARLNVITGRRPRHVVPLLDRLKKLAPENPDVYRYAAIYNVNTFFQYRTALKDMRRFVELRPDDPFGHNFIGFLRYRLGDYPASIDALERSAALQPDNVYAYALMARVYALLYHETKSTKYREQSLSMLEEAETAPTPNATRVARLRRWLDRRLN